MSLLVIKDTVIILSKHIIFEKRTSFAECLDIPRHQIIIWNNQLTWGQLLLEDFFTTILNDWVSRKGNSATNILLATILRKWDFVAAADLICPSKKESNSFGVEKPVRNFNGRELEVKELNNWLLRGSSNAFLISGIGGQGKTELCRRFIQQLGQDSKMLITWFCGENATTLLNSLSNCASSMNMPVQDVSINDLIKNISQSAAAFGTDFVWLAVIDNVDNEYIEFVPAVQEMSKNGAFALVTSTKTNILPPDSDYLALQELSENDSMEIVKNVLKNQPQKYVAELCKTLQHHPLALKDATDSINQRQRNVDNGFGIPEYLKEFNKDKEKSHTGKSICGYNKTLNENIETTIQKLIEIDINIETKSILVLHIISLIEPDKIPLKFLKDLFSIIAPQEKFDKSKEKLMNLCIIRNENGVVCIHRVVQKLARNNLKSRSLEIHLDILNKLLKGIDVLNLTSDELPHVTQLWIYATKEPETFLKNLKFYFDVIYRLIDLAFVPEAKEIARTTHKRIIKKGGAFERLRMEESWSHVLFSNDEYQEALDKYKVHWANKVEQEHDEAFLSLIAFILKKLKIENKLMEWEQIKFKNSAIVIGKNLKTKSFAKIGLANVLILKGKIEEALLILRQVLQFQEQTSSLEHQEVLRTRHHIAYCIYAEGKFEKAKMKLKELIKFSVKINETDDNVTYTIKSNLAYTLFSSREKSKEALKILEEVLIAREKEKGNNHPDTIRTRKAIFEINK